MKVIGFNDKDDYIAIVTHSELQRLMDKTYRTSSDGVPKLKVGAEFDLGAGFNFREHIKCACEAMVAADQRFDAARSTMMKFAVLIARQPVQGSDAA